MARLKFGFCPTEGGHFYREALTEVVRGEELGFDSVWIAEHHSVRDHYWPSPLQALTGFATRTSRLTLGANVLIFPFYHPVRLAEEVALLDVISGGRVVAGMAIGYKPDEFALYGAALEKRGARFEEGLALMKALWTGDGVTFRGRHFTVEDGLIEPKPVTKPHPRSGSAGGGIWPSRGRQRWPSAGFRGPRLTSRGSSTASGRSWRTGARQVCPPRRSGR